jgi:hypothetical protein
MLPKEQTAQVRDNKSLITVIFLAAKNLIVILKCFLLIFKT